MSEEYINLYNSVKKLMADDTTTDYMGIIKETVLLYMYNPDYLEPIGDLILFLNARKQHKLSYFVGKLIKSFNKPVNPKYPLNETYYDYKVMLESGIAAYYAGVKYECFNTMDKILDRGAELSHSVRYCCETNQSFELPALMAQYEQYPQSRIAEIMNNSLCTNIILTITSCKRLELFKHTINSFINCNNDYKLISQWICIDDNSSDADRKEMQVLYPFFKFIHKTPEERGHITSLNKIVDLVNGSPEVDYVLHLEDDWTFVKEHHYIRDALAIMDSDAKIGQVLINRNYTQDIDSQNANISGGEYCKSQLGGVSYIRHQYYPADTEEHHLYNGELPTSVNNTYWPHYSLRPSITRAKVFRDLGYFDNLYGHFEYIYGLDYIARGYYSVFFPKIYCIHTGPKSGENRGIPNSYVLNGVQQFEWRAPDPPQIPGWKFIAGKGIVSNTSIGINPTHTQLVELSESPMIQIISTDGKYSDYKSKSYVTLYKPNINFPYKTGLYVRDTQPEENNYYKYITSSHTDALAESASLECYYTHKFYAAALRICCLLIKHKSEVDIRLLRNREFITMALAESSLTTELAIYKQPKPLISMANDLLSDATHDAYFVSNGERSITDIKMDYIKYSDLFPNWQVLLLSKGMVVNKSGALYIVSNNITNKDALLKSSAVIINAIL